MEIEAIAEDDGTRIVFHGNIDLAVVDEVRKRLGEIGETHSPGFFLDFQNVEYVDSAGLGALVTFYKSQSGRAVVFKNVNERVNKLFQITRLDFLFKIE